jgi:hypothetical protein
MIVSVRRHGMVVQTIRVTGSHAKVGSAAGCEVQLADPLIAPLVAEFIGRGGIWRIVDAGTDPVGIQREGIQIFDEVIEPGAVYNIGAFELVTDANPARKLTQATAILGDDELDFNPPTQIDEAFPMTMIEADLGDSPSTVVQDLDEVRTPAKSLPKPRPSLSEPAPGKLVFQKSEKPSELPKPATRPRSKRDLAMYAAVAALAIIATVIGIRVTLSPAKTQPATQTVTAPAQPSAQSQIEAGDQFARDLQFDRALDAWEAAAQRINDPQLRAKIASGAAQLGHAYAAAHDDANAKKYFAKAAKYGGPAK